MIGTIIISVGFYFGLQNYRKKTSNYFFSEDTIVTKNISKINNSSRCLAKPEVLVTKVIDGDTIVVEGGYHIRLLSVDTDEMGFPCYESAKTRLEELVLNKKIRLEKDITDIDQYKRCLRHVFLDNSSTSSKQVQNIGLQLLKEGLAVARFYEPNVKYKKEITLAEKTAIDEKVGCKWKNK